MVKLKVGPLAIALMVASLETAFAGGGAGVGITSPSCGFGEGAPSTCVYPHSDCQGNHPNYETADLTFDSRINVDLDLLYSESFLRFAEHDGAHPGWPVTPGEREQLATQIDGFDNAANPLGPDYQHKWDLELVFNYYTHGSDLYGGFGLSSNFRFDNTFSGELESERNHVDIYLVPKFEYDGSQGCIESIGTGGYGCCLMHSGTSPATFTDDSEDPPFTEQCPGQEEFHGNSVQIWDHWGNYGNVADWSKASTVTFDHEFEHLIQADKFGIQQEPGLFEFFASTAEYLGDPIYPPGTGGLTDDICYDNTMANPSAVPVSNYSIWRTWGVYLLQHFRAGSGIADDLVRAWNRQGSRRLNSLALVLENSSYDGLGCTTCPGGGGPASGFKGQYRIQELNNRIGVARWVDNPNLEPGVVPPTGEGKWGYFLGFSPGNDVGMFRKIASSGAHCDYSHTLPPVYQLDSSNLNANTTVTCYINPLDPAPCPPTTMEDPGCAPRSSGLIDSPFCYKPSPYCMESQGCGDPIDLYPWAADVVGFVSSPYFTDGNYHELMTTFTFQGIPAGTDCDNQITQTANCSYRYFVNVVTYSKNDPVSELWNRGGYATSVTTYGPYLATSVRELQFTVGDFGCPLVRSVAFVITLADSVATAGPTKPWEYYKRLDYSYAYMVKSPNPGPGYICPSADPMCPFLHVEGTGGVLVDNNLLGEGAWHDGSVPESPDVTDRYVLSRSPALRNGMVHLTIREESNERTFLDEVRLVAYDVPERMELVRLVPGSRLGLVSPRALNSAVMDRTGRDVTEELLEMDRNVVEFQEGDYVEFDWTKTQGIGPEFIAVHPLLKARLEDSGSLVGNGRAGIVLQALSGDTWTDVVEFVPRERGDVQCVMASAIPGQPGDRIHLRLLSMARHQLDWIATGEWSEVEGTTLTLAEATHSARGNILRSLSSTDGRHETIAAAEEVSLAFSGYEPAPGRRLCLESTGHYLIPREVSSGNWTPGARIKVSDSTIAPESHPSRVVAFPNPTHSSTTIEIELPASERIEVGIYAIDGRLMKRLHGGTMNAGINQLLWDGRTESGMRASSGQYYYQVLSGSWSRTGKIFLIK